MHYREWKNLLHHYYDPFPEVEHYETGLLENNAPRDFTVAASGGEGRVVYNSSTLGNILEGS